MSMDFTFLKDAGLNVEKGMDYTGGEEKYLSAIQRYYKNFEKNKAKVAEFLADEDYESYMITVHALKSNSRMIGAMDMGDAFEELELSAKDGRADLILQNNDFIMQAYEELIEKISPVGEMGEVKAADEISAAEARETADRLLEALEDFDDDLAKELAGKLSGYPFRMTQKDKLNKAIEYINDFLYDDAAEIVKEIIPGIE